MSLGPDQDPSVQQVRFALTISHDDVEFLGKLATTMGWDATRLEEPEPEAAPVPIPIVGADLWALSTEVWGNERYGRTAEDALHIAARLEPTKYAREVHRSAYSNTLTLPGFVHDAVGTDVLDARRTQEMDAETARTWLQPLWDESIAPFPLSIEPADGGKDNVGNERVLKLKVGQAEKTRLARFLTAKELVSHGLHGSLGKAFDVLNLAAGVVDRDALGAADVDMGFIANDDVQAALRESGLKGYGRTKLHTRIQDALAHQLTTGQPPEYGEVVLEGDVYQHFTGKIKYEKIAVTSLHQMVKKYDRDDPLRIVIENL